MSRIIRVASVKQKECVACGSCVNVCPRKAITIPKGIFAVISSDRCIGCGMCEKECPASVIKIIKRENEENEK